MSTALQQSAGHGGAPPHTDEHAHPTTRKYVIIGIILAVITALEVWVYTIESLKFVLNYILIALSALKFGMVVGYFMHLRFDSRIFLAMFGFGLFIATSIVTVLLLLFAQNPLPAHVTPPPAGH